MQEIKNFVNLFIEIFIQFLNDRLICVKITTDKDKALFCLT